MEGLYLLFIFHPVKYMTILFRLFLMVTFLMETFYRYIYDCFQSVLNIKSYLVYIYIYICIKTQQPYLAQYQENVIGS